MTTPTPQQYEAEIQRLEQELAATKVKAFDKISHLEEQNKFLERRVNALNEGYMQLAEALGLKPDNLNVADIVELVKKTDDSEEVEEDGVA